MIAHQVEDIAGWPDARIKQSFAQAIIGEF
jgi:hypothetical protein